LSSSVAGREISEADLGAERAGEGAAQQVGDEAGGAFGGLERDVAGKAVGHDHVDVAARQSCRPR
jgi:hypothetical protein